MIRVDPSYTNTRVGEQLLKHYAQRHAVRHATPLFPFSLSSLFVKRQARETDAHALPAGTASSQA